MLSCRTPSAPSTCIWPSGVVYSFNGPTQMKLRAIVFWMVLAAVMAAAREPQLLRQVRKQQLIDAIQHALLESFEAEKSAVLSTTDEESRALAQEAHRSAARSIAAAQRVAPTHRCGRAGPGDPEARRLRRRVGGARERG